MIMSYRFVLDMEVAKTTHWMFVMIICYSDILLKYSTLPCLLLSVIAGDCLSISIAMRAPALLAQCLPGLVPNDRGSLNISSVPEKEIHLPSPAVEILPSKVQFIFKPSTIQ